MVVAIIPARYGSTRFPGKPLAKIAGQSMIERVWRATCNASGIDRVVIATESELVANEAMRISAEFCLTSPDLVSGTDRCAAAVKELQLNASVILNVQGDEPLLDPEILSKLVSELKGSDADVTTPVIRVTDVEDLSNPNYVTVACTSEMQALYFSRSAIPNVRGVEMEQWLQHATYWKHVGLYCYRTAAILRHVELPPTALELAEQLEQLRLLEDGKKFLCVPITQHLVAVDVPSDVQKVEAILAESRPN
ncbi:MAG: 3-deoxy-manno-octulosonate cytidylyltransferase [Ignavibacteria bacterium]|nr:3-deoxy-manno-octulosonate cytidylyltransferase [Ignavibacteria bacterium]